MRTFKIVLAGDGGVGKTTLLDAFRLGKFFQHKTTIGLSISLCTVNLERGVKCKLIVYDFSGQPRFMRLAHEIPRIIRGAQGAILVFDLSSFATLLVLDRWADIIRRVNGDIPIILVGTKADLEPEVGEDDIREFAERLGARAFVKTSSKLMLNVDKPFKLLVQMMMERQEAYTPLAVRFMSSEIRMKAEDGQSG